MNDKIEKFECLKVLAEMKHRYAHEGFILRGLFGSFARNDFDEMSDIDLAYEIEQEVFFKNYEGFRAVSRIAEICNELEVAFGRKVDLFSLNSKNSDFIDEIKREMIDA